MKAEAPEALLSQTTQAEKTKGAKSKALASAASSGRKGITPFWRLMNARGTDAAMTAKAETAETAAGNGAESLKKNLALALAAAAGKKPAAAPRAAAPHAEAAQSGMAADRLAESQEGKASARKKTSLHLASLADVAAADQSPTQAVKKLADASPAKGAEEAAAAQVKAVSDGARAAAVKTPEPVIRVVDLRTGRDAAAEAVSTAHGSKTALAAETADGGDGVSFAQRLSAQADAGPELPQRAEPSAAGQAPAQTPLERLQDMAGSELTRATNLILKDGGGEIRLVLKPDSLGSVRIRMNIVDNAIEGTIIVDSAAVKHVIDGSIDALRRAFTAEGFQAGSLNVSVGGQNADSGARREREEARAAAVRRVESAQGFSQNIPGVENASMGDLLVNLFV